MPELGVDNPLEHNVLLYDGEELVGAKQNRILDLTVLVGAKTRFPCGFASSSSLEPECNKETLFGTGNNGLL